MSPELVSLKSTIEVELVDPKGNLAENKKPPHVTRDMKAPRESAG